MATARRPARSASRREQPSRRDLFELGDLVLALVAAPSSPAAGSPAPDRRIPNWSPWSAQPPARPPTRRRRAAPPPPAYRRPAPGRWPPGRPRPGHRCKGGLRAEVAGGALDDLQLAGGHRGGVRGVSRRHTILGGLQCGRIIPRDDFAVVVVADRQDSTDHRRRRSAQQAAQIPTSPATAQPRRRRPVLGSSIPRLLGVWVSSVSGLSALFGSALPLVWRVLSIGGVQLAGASISFHPSSPGLLELLTEYFTPSGPTTSPLAGL